MKSLIQRRALRSGDRDIGYEIRRSTRARSRITVRVQPDCTVVVTAPRWASLANIHEVVVAYAAWIEKRLAAFQKDGPPYRPEYRAGAPHFYLGESYQIALRAAAGRRAKARIIGDRLHVEAGDHAPDAVRDVLRRWYREQAMQCFTERLALLVPSLPWVRRLPPWRVRRMRTQWGSCSSRGDMCFNTHLVKATLTQVDYVLLHELCHLKHMDHGPGFQKLMDQHMPDWREHRRALNAVSHRLLVD